MMQYFTLLFSFDKSSEEWQHLFETLPQVPSLVAPRNVNQLPERRSLVDVDPNSCVHQGESKCSHLMQIVIDSFFSLSGSGLHT